MSCLGQPPERQRCAGMPKMTVAQRRCPPKTSDPRPTQSSTMWMTAARTARTHRAARSSTCAIQPAGCLDAGRPPIVVAAGGPMSPMLTSRLRKVGVFSVRVSDFRTGGQSILGSFLPPDFLALSAGLKASFVFRVYIGRHGPVYRPNFCSLDCYRLSCISDRWARGQSILGSLLPVHSSWLQGPVAGPASGSGYC